MFTLWLDNGDSYENHEIQLLGVFSTRKLAWESGQQAKEIIIQKAEEYMKRFPNAQKYYVQFSCFGITINYVNHEIYIEEIQENTLRST